VFQPGRTLNHRCEIARRSEAVDVTATTSQPSIQPVCQRVRVRNRDVERPVRFDDPADLFQRARKIVEVLQAVVRNDGVKMTCREWELCGVRLDKPGNVNAGTFQVNPDDGKGMVVWKEGARPAPEVEDCASRCNCCQKLVHISRAGSPERLRP
jgi:hypothetical protein